MFHCDQKLIICAFFAGNLIACEAWAIPCERYYASQLAAMSDNEKAHYEAACPIAVEEIGYYSPESQVAWKQDNDSKASFWDNWGGFVDSPVFSSQSDSTFYGLGIWIPEKYEDVDILTFEDVQDWLKIHGVQMSLGLGGEDGRSPRFRLDYRWHDDSLDDVFLQVEIPFQ